MWMIVGASCRAATGLIEAINRLPRRIARLF